MYYSHGHYFCRYIQINMSTMIITISAPVLACMALPIGLSRLDFLLSAHRENAP